MRNYIKKNYQIILHYIIYINYSTRNNMLKMSNKVKEMDIKIQTYYFFEYIINMKHFDPNSIKIDGKL